MDSNVYLEESKRTAPAATEIRSDLFPTHVDLLMNLNNSIRTPGAVADLQKRQIFYNESPEKSLERQVKAFDDIEITFEELADFKEDNPDFKLTQKQIEIIHAVLGIMSECEEIIDNLSKSVIRGEEFDDKNGIEEGGDLTWYIALYLRAIGTDFGTTFRKNIAKLYVRFKDKFSGSQALSRDLLEEADALEK